MLQTQVGLAGGEWSTCYNLSLFSFSFLHTHYLVHTDTGTSLYDNQVFLWLHRDTENQHSMTNFRLNLASVCVRVWEGA